MNDAQKDKQQKEVNAVVRRVLADFVGREITPLLAAEAEGQVREALVGMITRGDYVLPDGLWLDRVELSPDMMIHVYFRRAVPA